MISLDGSPALTERVRTMTAVMHHRGPDDQAVWSAERIALGATRLKIVDLTEAGRQPMTSADGRATLVYNGEIYNQLSLREELKRNGVQFRSRSDTEVLLEAWRMWGERSFSMFDGMFAVAVWDAGSRSLLLARDSLGIKPLYYTRIGDIVAFASEARALIAIDNSLGDFRREALEEYLTFRDVAGEGSLFGRIQRLLPGHAFRISQTESRTWKFTGDSNRKPADDDLETTIDRSVRSQMAADVPVGTLCSGGIDSGLVTYFAARAAVKPLKAFTVTFPGSPLDEFESARATANLVGAEHFVLEADPRKFADDLPKLARHCDEPIKYENTVLLYQVCAMARDAGVIVLLSGEGADELFGGYPHFVGMARLSRYRLWQGAFLGGVRPSRLPLPVRLRRAVYRLTADTDDLLMYSSAFTSSGDLEKLLRRSVTGNFPFRRSVLSATRGLGLAERMRRYDIATYLPPILMRQDKASMAASVETRVPMLGREVVAEALSISAQRLANGSGKLPLRRLAERKLPPATLLGRKIGFSVPIGDWIRREPRLREMAGALADAGARVGSILDRQFIAGVIHQHLSGAADQGQLLWTIMALELWLRECCAPVASIPSADSVPA